MVAESNKLGGAQTGATGATVLLGLYRAIRKYWVIVVACVTLSAGLALVYSRTLPRVFQAAAMLELDPSAIRPMSDKMDNIMPLGTGDFYDTREYYETQYRIITSSRVLEAAARDIGLQSDHQFFGLKTPPTRSVTVQEAAQALRGRVSVDPLKGSRLLFIKVEDVDPERSKRLANAVANAFIDQNLEKAVTTTSDSVEWLNSQVDQVKRELEGNETALHQFKKSNDLPSTSINEASNMLRLEMQDLNSALTRTRTRKQELLARHGELSKLLKDNPEDLPASELLNSTYLQQLRKDYVDVLRERRGLIAEGKGENHPSVRAVDQKIAESKSALLAEIRNIHGAVERDLAIVNREEAGQAALYEAAHKRAVDLNMKEIEYHRLDRSRGQNEKLYAMLLDHLKDADLARMMRVNNIHLIEPATTPGAPIRPRTAVNVMMAMAAGLLLGVALIWLRETLDSSLKTPEDVENTLGVTFLGLLPALDSERADRKGRGKRRAMRPTAKPGAPPELIVQHQPHSGIAEAARSIRTNLLFTNPDQPFRRLLVTSAAPAEGKTTVACSIAIALAQSGQRVCIIDCDLRRPRLHRIFGRAGDSGVTNVLVGEVSVSDVARPTEVENLFCIPSGPTPPNPADLLHSERFKRFIEAVSEQFDRVVIDSPPLVAVTDSAIISTLVDGTVFVIRAFSTTRALGQQGMRTLADVDAPLAGVVLNAVDLNRHEYSYHQYYYYKRDGYGSLPPPSPPGSITEGGETAVAS